jgi:uncharacterized membrane protein
MSTENITIGLALVLSGALTMAACLPLLKGQVKPNVLYGIRMAKSFESDENWFKMNRYGARQMMLWAAVMMAFGFVAFFLPLRGNETLAVIVGLVPVLLLFIPVIRIYRYSKMI